MFFPFRLKSTASIVLAVALCALAACNHTRKHDRDMQSGPEVLYRNAHTALKSGDFDKATKSYETLEARFPFSDEARQGRLDLMYAYYKHRDVEQAVDAADQFIRENPTHPRIDYAYYIKGLVYFEGEPGRLGRLFDVDPSQRPPVDALKSFSAFQTVVKQYPKSEYAHDARRRMIYLRNRLADYEVAVARYYVNRGAYVGAIARAKYAVENYDGAPAIREALVLMARGYNELGMKELAEQTERVYRENFANDDPDKLTKKKRRWWFW